MNSPRVKFYRSALAALVESLEAVVRIARWDDPAEAAPEALRTDASKLLDRLGTANRLVTDTFAGSATDAAKVNVIRGAMKRLDSAYVVYRQQGIAPSVGGNNAAMLLEMEIAEVKLAHVAV